MSKNDDLVRRLRKRADHFGDILTDPPRPHPDAELLREASTAIERSAAQVSVTDEMVREARQELGRRGVHIGLPLNDDERNEAMRAALEAAFDTLPAPAVEAEVVATKHVSQKTSETVFTKGWSPSLLGFSSEPLYSEAALKAKTDEIERLRRELAEADRLGTAWFETHLAHRKALDALGAANGELLKRAMDAESRAEAAEASNKALRKAVLTVVSQMKEDDTIDTEDWESILLKGASS